MSVECDPQILKEELNRFILGTGAERALLVLFQGPDQAARIQARFGLPEEKGLTELGLCEEVLETVFQKGEAIRIEQASAQLARPVSGVNSVLALPILDLADNPKGVLYGDHSVSHTFSVEDLIGARSIAYSLENTLEQAINVVLPSDGDWATLQIDRTAFWLRLRRQGLMALQAEKLGLAEENLKSAVQLAKKWGDREKPRQARTQRELGQVYLRQKKPQIAKQYLQSSLEIHQERRRPANPEMAACLAALGAAELAQGDARKAQEHFGQADQIWAKLGNPDHGERALLLDAVGGLCFSCSDFLEAERFCREAVAMATRLWGVEDGRTKRFQRHLNRARKKAQKPL